MYKFNVFGHGLYLSISWLFSNLAHIYFTFHDLLTYSSVNVLKPFMQNHSERSMYISLFERDVSRCSSNINGFFHQYHILKNNRGKGGRVNHKEQERKVSRLRCIPVTRFWGGGGSNPKLILVFHTLRALQTVGEAYPK